MKEFMEITKALADENRVRILYALEGRELCVCQITELVQLAPSTVSKHIAILKHACLVETRKAGRWIYYRPAGKEASFMVRETLHWVHHSLNKTRRYREDMTRLKEILKIPPEILCHPEKC